MPARLSQCSKNYLRVYRQPPLLASEEVLMVVESQNHLHSAKKGLCFVPLNQTENMDHADSTNNGRRVQVVSNSIFCQTFLNQIQYYCFSIFYV